MNKSELREAMKIDRAAMLLEDVAAMSASVQTLLLELPEVTAAQSIFVYVSFRNEVRTHGLIDALVEAGRRIFVPRIVGTGWMEAVEFPGWDGMQRDSFGFLTPVSETPHEGPLDICLAPGLAFTIAGDRLGFGQGHYDRFLADKLGLTSVGLAFEWQILEQVPTEATDQRMDLIVTEARAIQCS